MTVKAARLPLSLSALALLFACAPQVVTQPVPVSTDPPGAQVLVDGAPACQTPCQVDLPRNQDHLLTLRKDGYRQQDVAVKRQYQSAKVMLNAINEGVRSNDFFKNAAWGLGGGVQSVNRQEDTGEAYVLTPSTLSVRLAPLAGFGPAPAPAESAGKVPAPVDMRALMRRMDPGDEQMLENALEGTRSGQPAVWTNPESMTRFSVVPEPASVSSSGAVVRWFTLAVRRGGVSDVAHAAARRVGNGEWLVDLGAAPVQEQAQAPAQGQIQGTTPATFPGQPGQPGTSAGAPDQGAQDISSAETLRALGDAPWPQAHKSWDVGSSGSTKTSTSYGADGSRSTTTTTTRTSAKASVSVGPGAAITALGALEDLFGGGSGK